MKRNVQLTLIITTAMTLSGYAQVNRSNLMGNWKLNYAVTLDGLNSGGQAKYDALSQASKSYLQSTMDGLALIFSTDGSYSLNSPDGDVIYGNWQWADTGNTLEVTINGAGTKQQQVKILDSDKLVLQIQDPANPKVVFHTWYLEKQ